MQHQIYTDFFFSSCDVLHRRYAPAATTFNGELYVLGGRGSSGPYLNTVEKFNGVQWQPVAPMWNARRYFDAAVYNNRLYVVGGAPESVADKVEYFDGVAWRIASAVLDSSQGGATVSAFSGMLFVLGGAHSADGVDYTVVDTVQTFDSDKKNSSARGTGAWSTSSASMLTTRYYHSAIVYPPEALPDVRLAPPTDYIYALGGYDGSSVLKTVERFDGASWMADAPMVTDRHDLAAAVFDNHLYAIGGSSGGYCGSAPSLSTVERFDGNAWEEAPSMEIARCGFGAATCLDALYVVGGTDIGLSSMVSVERFDGERWQSTVPMTNARGNPTVVCFRGRLFAIGGFQMRSVEAFDGKDWTEVGPTPTIKYNAAAGVVNNLLYVVGGSNECCGHMDDVEQFDGVAWKSLTAISPMPTPRNSYGAAVLHGQLYPVGGHNVNYGVHLSTVERFDGVSSWQTVESMGSRRSDHAVATFSPTVVSGTTAESRPPRRLFVIGGSNSSRVGGAVPTSTVQLFDGKSWSTAKAGLLTARHGHAASVYKRRIIVTGGSYSNTVEMYDGIRWSAAPPMTRSRIFHASTVFDGRLYAIGGYPLTASVETFDGIEWSPSIDMQQSRAYLTATTYASAIYVLGGISGSSHLTSVERFDGRAWSFVASLSSPGRVELASAFYQGSLYSIGGSAAGVGAINIVEKLTCDHNQGTTDGWEPSAPLRESRNGHAAVVFNDSIYTLGGYSNGQNMLSVEHFDGVRWNDAPGMPIYADNTAAVVYP